MNTTKRYARRAALAALVAGSLATVGLEAGASGTAPTASPHNVTQSAVRVINPQPLPPEHTTVHVINPQPLPPEHTTVHV